MTIFLKKTDYDVVYILSCSAHPEQLKLTVPFVKISRVWSLQHMLICCCGGAELWILRFLMVDMWFLLMPLYNIYISVALSGYSTRFSSCFNLSRGFLVKQSHVGNIKFVSKSKSNFVVSGFKLHSGDIRHSHQKARHYFEHVKLNIAAFMKWHLLKDIVTWKSVAVFIIAIEIRSSRCEMRKHLWKLGCRSRPASQSKTLMVILLRLYPPQLHNFRH